MKKLLALSGLLAFIVAPAFADTYVNVSHPNAVWDSTTQSLYALGVPGQGQTGLTVIPSAATTNTWSGVNNFTSTFEIGGTTETFPASGFIAGTTDTQTLSGKTLASPIITGPAPVACGATCTVTSANAGETILLNTAAGSAATLPAASGTGNTYKFVVSTTTTSGAHKILAASTSDALIGTEIGWTGSTAKVFACGAGTTHAIQMPYSGTQPSGGFAGDVFTYTDVATNIWLVQGVYQAGTTPTTPCSATNT